MIESPSPDDIKEWKREYGRIFSASIAGVDYVFRALTFQEYDELLNIEQQSGSAETEEGVVAFGLINPQGVDFSTVPAGVVSTLAEEILEISGFGTARYAKQVLDQHREDAQSVRGLMKAFVLATMTAYKEEDLDALTFFELAKKVALAEQILQVHQASMGVDNQVVLDLIDPEEEAAKQQAEAVKHAAQKKPGQAGYNDPIAQKLAEALR